MKTSQPINLGESFAWAAVLVLTSLGVIVLMMVATGIL